jgi:uncharacterized membrane protein (DUF485 family)
MNSDMVKDILANPKYQELIQKRGRFAWILSIIVLIVYFGFVLIVAFDPKLLAIKLYGVTTLAIPVGVAIIIMSFVLTGIYVKRANSEFDDMVTEIKNSIKKG